MNEKNKIIDIQSEVSSLQPQYKKAFIRIKRESLLANNNNIYASKEESNFTSNPPSITLIDSTY